MGNDDPREEVPMTVTTVLAGSVAVVATPFRVELRPAQLAGPRRRA
jgi:hypothetical protein